MTLIESIDHFLEAATAAHKERVVRPMERKLQKAMAKAFTKQGEAFLKGFAGLSGQFQEAITEAAWMRVFDAAAKATFDLFLDPIEATAAAGLTAGAEAVIGELSLDIAFNLKNPRAVAYMQAHGAANVTGINQTTKDELRTLMTQSVDEGWSYQRTAKAIKDRYAGFAGTVPQQHIRSRAELVAITESGEAYESGSEIVVMDLADAGLKMEKSWLTVGDDRVSEGCIANQAAGWIAVSEAFPSGHSRPLRFPGCRCAGLYRRAA